MKRKSFIILLLLALSLTGLYAFAAEMVESPDTCKYCAMDRTLFAHSRMLIEYDDHTTTGTCSIHCLAIELATTIDKTPASIKVGDFNSKNLIDAETAAWVIGGEKPGVMTGRAKWAFTNKADAAAYISRNKGTIATFDDAMKAAYEDMYKDSKMIRDKRKQMKLKMKAAAGAPPQHQH